MYLGLVKFNYSGVKRLSVSGGFNLYIGNYWELLMIPMVYSAESVPTGIYWSSSSYFYSV